MKALAASLCGWIVLAPAGPAAPQGLNRAADPEAVVVEELVVRGRTPGPAWWRVSDADSTVWVLGVPSYLPKNTAWNDLPLKARLAQSKLLIMPPQAHVGPLKAIGWFLKNRKALKSPAPLETALPPDLARRFASARASLGKPAKRYANWRPAMAAVILDGDFRSSVRLDPGEPLEHIRALGHKAGVRERRAADYPAGPILDQVLTMSEAAHEACLSDALAEVEAGSARAVAAARGWAEGDVRAALTLERGYDRCFAALPAMSELITRSQADMASAIAQALDRPGETVAVVELRALLAQGGVLERLKARGVTAMTPQ